MDMPRPIRVLIVDDHAGIRVGISSLVDAEHPRMCSVGTAATSAEAVAQAHALQPDVVVLDVNLDGEDGLALIPTLQRAASCEIVVLTSLMDPQLALHAYRLGARACLHKAAPAGELVQIIRNAGCFVENAPSEPHDSPVNAGVVLSQASGSKHPRNSGETADGPSFYAAESLLKGS